MTDNSDLRNYGFKHIPQKYAWMTPGWIDKLIKHEPDEEVKNYITSILEDLTSPEKSRLESSTDNLDSLEDYSFNRLLANGSKLEFDKVYMWLLVSKEFFVEKEAYELCYNIQKAIEIIKRNIDDIEENSNTQSSDDGLPF